MSEYFKTFNIVYKREYQDPEDGYETFWSSSTLYRNVPIEKKKYYQKRLVMFKDIMDKSYKEDATNFLGSTGIEIVYPDEYYQTYEDVFGSETAAGDDNLFNDYGQLFNGRQGFRKDFDPDFTKNYKTKRQYIYKLN
tara:strand:+ start:3577 stop:3987 length:411 start_codon:yes stop_codon:yes gene_type:complete